ncbi:Thioredoxin H5 [Striga hermonthica]|uniref:Thioredoxin H5 n=1 Tax=Striga hermonthica TaxID=68872 RepID=A0A9N7NUY4_STRHE|nr:Thioredoxin H5 [Striga hermonthica]
MAAAAAAAAAEEGQVISVHSIDEWKLHLKRGLDSKKLVVVDFTASWCPPCRFIAPVLAEMAKKTPHVIFLKVDVDELQAVAQEYEVEAMPTFLFFKEGKVIDRIVGADKDDLQKKVAIHGALTTTA